MVLEVVLTVTLKFDADVPLILSVLGTLQILPFGAPVISATPFR